MSKTKAGIILSAALLIGNIFQFFQSIIVVYFFAPDILVSYRFGVLLVSFFPLATLGMIDSIFYFISGRYEKDAGNYVGNTLIICTIISLFILLIFHLILKPYVLIYTDMAPYLNEVSAYVYIGSFIFINLTAHNALVGYNQVTIASQVRVFQIGIRFIAIASTLYFGIIQSIHAFILLIVFLEIGQTFLYVLVLLRKKLLSFHFKDINRKAQLNYSFVLGITRFVPFLSVNIDKIMIVMLMGTSSFAIFSVAAVELPLAGIVISVFGSVLFSTYVKYVEAHDYQNIIKIWHKSSIRGMIINVPAGVCIFFYSDVLFRLIIPEDYYEGHQVFGIYALLLLLRFNDSDVLAKVLNQNAIILKASTLGLITNIIGTYVFIKLFGLWGAALATLCGLVVAWLYYLRAYARLLESRVSHIFPWKPYAILMGISVTFFGISKMMIHHIGISIVLVILGGVTYIYYVFTILDQTERDYILTRLKRL